MLSISSWLCTIIFLVLVIGFTDFFVKIPYENRCEMTYMYQVPQYVPIDLGVNVNKDFPDYNLYAYGEGDYAESLGLNEFNGIPVLFVPGNGGSYKQARSLASVSLVMAYTTRAAHFNYFTLDYNEELSAFIGEKLESQTQFLYHAIKKILQLYTNAPKVKIVLIGHSIGGILIKTLFSKPNFKPYLSRVAIVITLATPHRSPAIPFDLKILNFYSRLYSQFAEERQTDFGHINFVSIGGSSNDKLIRSDLISLRSEYQLDVSLLTTVVDDVWASADHLCIVWCRQLMIKLNQILFDLVDENLNLLESPSRRQDIIDYHLTNRYFKGPYPNYKILKRTIYSNRTDWVEHSTRLVRLNISKLVNPTNHLFPLNERETIVLHIVGQFKHNTISVCKAVQLEDKLICADDGLNLYDQVKLVPSKSNDDRHLAQLRSSTYLQMGFTHLVLSLTPSPSPYSALVDRFTTSLRQHSITLPSLWSLIFTGGLFKPTVVFTKVVSQEQSFFNITLNNFDFVWQTYFLQVQTKSCYRSASSFVGYAYLSLEQPELNEYYWPFVPLKGANLQFTLKLSRDHGRTDSSKKPSLSLHLEPNCGFEVSAKFSVIDFSSQMVKHYFTLLVPVIISTAILVVSVQLSNMMLVFSYSDEDWDKFKSQYHTEPSDSKLSTRKCVIYLSAPNVMTTGRYFSYCFGLILLSSLLAMFIAKRFYPWHDLANLTELPPVFLLLVCSIIFLFAYSLIFCFTALIHFLANNFANGINYVRIRSQLLPAFNWPLKRFFQFLISFRWPRICTCLVISSLISAFIFLTQSVFYLVHMFFTILMLVRFIKVNYLEMRIGRTTSSTFIRALYPVIYALQLVIAVLHIPQCIDSFKSFTTPNPYLSGQSSVLRLSLGHFVDTLLRQPLACFQALLCIALYFLLHYNSLRLSSRLSSITTNRGIFPPIHNRTTCRRLAAGVCSAESARRLSGPMEAELGSGPAFDIISISLGTDGAHSGSRDHTATSKEPAEDTSRRLYAYTFPSPVTSAYGDSDLNSHSHSTASCPENWRDDVCTCLKHCSRRPPSMEATHSPTLDPSEPNSDRESNSSSDLVDRQAVRDFARANETHDLVANITLKRRHPLTTSSTAATGDSAAGKRCLSMLGPNMVAFLRNENLTGNSGRAKRVLFPLILLFSIIALVLLHNGSLRTRKAPSPSIFFTSGNPFISEFEFGQMKDLWSRISQNEVSFIMYYAPWDSDCIRARNEFEIVSNHYGQQIFFGAINCWWPEGECRKYQSIHRYPHLVAHIRTEGEVEYKGPILASYIIPFLDNVMNPLVPIQNEGELLDLRSKHDAVLLGYFNFLESPHQSGYHAYLSTSIKALVSDPWRNVAFTVVTSARVAAKLKIDPTRESSLLLFVGNSTEQFGRIQFAKPAAILSWIYSRASTASTLKWLNPSGIKSTRIADYIQKSPTFILFTPRSFILGISPYFDLLREIVLDYYNCDNSPVIRSLIHRNILRRRLLEDKLSELEERCHELLDEEETSFEEAGRSALRTSRYSDNEDTCCHTQTVKWRSFGGARRGMTKKCMCTSCVHISLPKCPARCSHFDCLSTASRFLDDFEPNSVNNSAVYCNQIKSLYEPRYTSYYKISTTCSGSLSAASGSEDGGQWHDVDKYSALSADEKISWMIQDFEIQHCRRLKLGMNYTDLNFPDSSESRQINWRANFTGLSCRTNRTLKFFSLDSALYPAFAESLGIDVFNVPHSTVALIIDPSNENVHVLNHEILYKEVELPNFDSKSVVSVPVNSYSKRSFVEFIKNFTEGTLPRFLRSQIVSSSGLCDLKQMILHQDAQLPGKQSNVICVPELNTVTFTQFVLGKSFEGSDNRTKPRSRLLDRDVLVMYYAPWCGFCTSIAHIYLDVARFFAFSKDIVFARINGDANDLPWEYTVDRYPTIMLFPAKKPANSLAYPATQVTQLGLMKFIMKHGQMSLRIQTMLALCDDSCLLQKQILSSNARRSLWRAVRSNMQSAMLNNFEINKLLRNSSRNKPKNNNKERVAKLKTYGHFLQRNIRRLRALELRQSLLSSLLTQRLNAAGKSMDPYMHELSQELFQPKKRPLKRPKASTGKVVVKAKDGKAAAIRQSGAHRVSSKDEL